MNREPLSIGEFERTMARLERGQTERFDRIDRTQEAQAKALSRIERQLAGHEQRLDALDSFSTAKATGVQGASGPAPRRPGEEHLSLSASKGMWAAIGAGLAAVLGFAAKALGYFRAPQ